MSRPLRLLTSAAVLAACATRASAQFPDRFVAVPIAATWQQPVGVTYSSNGTLFVWEKAGRVWTVVNGVKSAAPLIDIHEEVGDWRDFGLLGLALDPAFATNGRVYLSYVVDYHYLRWFGTPQYDPNANEYFHDTIGRITRYSVDTTTTPWTLVPNSRAVLVGESMTTGIPICHQSHGVGALRFGSDGTLLAVAGDGASYDTTATGGPTGGSSNTALADGIIRPKEDVGAFRAQLVDSLSGKVMRIDPQTGDGVPSNPFYDPLAPRAPRSRVWGLGLRNPFRVTRQEGTGSSDPAAGNPGTLWIGDVGWNTWEELDVCDGPAHNFGWPLFEGLTPQTSYQGASTVNQDAPNPLAGQGGCQPFVPFRNLLVQETLATPSWPNPCDASVELPATLDRFMHARPLLDWIHGTNQARAAAFQGTTAAAIPLGAPGSPLTGPQFAGNCAGGAAWYSGTDFPAEYRHSLFFADFVRSWIRRVVFNAQGVPVEIRPFASGNEVSGIVDLATDPVSGGLTYIKYLPGTGSQVLRVSYVPNIPPLAVAAASASYGPAPLAVQFTSAGSVDPDGSPVHYAWDFGDGYTSTAANPQHVFDSTLEVTTQGTVVARVFELVPPLPTGEGSRDPEILRDGDYPPLGTTDPTRQFDTFHAGAQGDFDWIGYEFATPQLFRALVFQEGLHYVDGGWFDQLGVEVYSHGAWTPVAGLTSTPAYAGAAGASFVTYRLDFAPTPGTRVRIVGAPGGAADYISVAELRVLAEDPAAASLPTRRDVVLRVIDAEGASSTAGLIVSLNNTPPVVSITSPVDGSLYAITGPVVLPLTANVVDAEHSGAGLACAWQTILHHNEHSHPEPIDPACATTTQITPEGCDGNDYHFEIHLTVTDAAGLSGSDAAHIYPDCAPLPFCFGDGSGTACPCGNNGSPGRGCDNSFGTGGGLATASGSARVGSDALLLSVTGLPPAASCLYFQGSGVVAGGAGTAFGDGLRCAGGATVRLGTRIASAGASSMGAPAGDAPLSVTGQIPAEGGVRNYQVWYRNAASFCTIDGFNLTNAVRITWIP